MATYYLDKKDLNKNKNICIKVFSCYHNDDTAQQTFQAIIPLRVGATKSSTSNTLRDDTSNNISAKNPYYCELTGTYWIWKNAQADIVGLFHYRRVLNFANTDSKIDVINNKTALKYKITNATIQNILQEYDLILPCKSKKTKISVYDYYCQAHIGSDMDLVLEIIKQKYPNDYTTAVNELKNNTQMFLGNMLIANKKVFDTYAEWLFSILFEVEKKIQPSVLQRDTYQQRVYGFLAERLMGVFIATHPHLKVKQVPLLFVEKDKKKYRKYKFKQLKRKILTSIGLGKKEWQI